MSIHEAIILLKSLPSDLQAEAAHFIEFLSLKNETSETMTKSLSERRKENFGRLKGKITIQPGFNDPIEGFEPYLP